MLENSMVKDELWEKEYRVVAHCCVCNEEILADGSTYYDFDGDIVCMCCLKDYAETNYMKRTEIE